MRLSRLPFFRMGEKMTTRSFSIIFGFLIISAALASDTPETHDVLAKWRGGSLSREHFIQEYDPDEAILKAGGRNLIKAVYKASFQEIYGALALASGIHESPAFLEELESWRRKHLASTFIERHRPTLEFSVEELRAEYERQREERFTSSGVADLDVLFVRCRAAEVGNCKERMSSYQSRLEDGERVSVLITEEKARSGEANGSFKKVPLTSLSTELREAVLRTSDEGLTELISTPQGFFLIRVSSLEKPASIPFEKARKVIRKELVREKEAEWRRQEGESIRLALRESDTSALDETSLFALAAREARVHLEASFISAERDRRRWMLADAGFLEDHLLLPSDEKVREDLKDPKVRIEHEKRSFLLAVVSAKKARDQLVEKADFLRQEIESAEDPAEKLHQLAREDGAVKVFRIPEILFSEWRRIHPSFSQKAFELAVPSWIGPLALRESFVVSGEVAGSKEDLSIPAGVGFIVIEEVSLRPIEEIREDYYRKARHNIGSMSSFEEFVAPRWDFELLVETTP